MAGQSAQQQPCPDPSVHGHSRDLSSAASTAALYVTDPAHKKDTKQNPLGPDGKLSSASAAASLKYARPETLPSYPSAGLPLSGSAGKAALQAQGVKAREYEVPEASSAGSRAALMAHRKGPDLNLWQPSASNDGNSAAVLALKAKGLSPDLDRGYTDDGKHKALLAATKSVHGRPASETRSTPSPNLYPDQHNSTKNALSAATVSHKASVKGPPDGWDSDANQAARIKNVHGFSPDMYTDHPPLPEDEETKRQNALRASAISMAKQMYEYQNRTMIEPSLTGSRAGADAANARKQPTEQLDVKQEAQRYIHLQEAAKKLADERLAKADKNYEAARFREYYGYPDESPRRGKSLRMSMRRQSSRRDVGVNDGDDSDDEEQARRIRSQMNQLNSGLSDVDKKKRTSDRAALMAAAEKKVHGQLDTMDKKVFSETGKVPPSILEEWERKAREKAEAERELASRPENKGKTHIGGGKFIDQSELDAIAAARLQPTLDEIADTAEKKRKHDEEMRIAADQEHTRKMEEKMKRDQEKEEARARKAEQKAQDRKSKQEWDTYRQKEKDEKRKEKEEERRRQRAEEDRVKAEQAKLKEEQGRTSAEGVAGAGDEGDTAGKDQNKRQSMRGRVKSMLRRSMGEQKPNSENKGTHGGTAAAAGAAGAAAGGVAAAEADKKEEPEETDEKEKRESAELSQDKNEEQRAAADSDPERDQPTDDDEEEDPSRGGSKLRPNLERHITHELDSSESGSDNEWNSGDESLQEPDKAKDRDELAEKGKNVIGATDGEDEGKDEIKDEGKDENKDESKESTGDLGQEEAHRAADRVGTAPVGDDAEYKTDEKGTETLPEKQEQQHDATTAAAAVGGAAAGGGGALAGAAASDQKESLAKTGKYGSSEKEKKGLRGFFSKLKHRDSKDASVAESKPKTPTEAPKATSEAPKVTSEAPKTQSETETAENNAIEGATPATGVAAADATVLGGEPKAAAEEPKVSTSTDMPVSSHAADADRSGSSEPKVSPLGSRASSSSFQRHADDLPNISDASSSGAEEDDIKRGRANSGVGSRMASKHDQQQPKISMDKTDGEDDDEQFYESTDQFDSSGLAPPTFTAQKSESPSRATRFSEDL